MSVFAWFPKVKWQLADEKYETFESVTSRIQELVIATRYAYLAIYSCLTDPEGTVVDNGKQGLVIQGTVAEKTGNLLLGEHPWKSLRLAHFWKHETVRLLKPHHLVVGLQSEHSVLEERDAATVLGKECGQVVVDVCLGELLRQLIEKQHCLSNLQTIIMNTVVCILCDAQFFSKQFDTFPKIGNGFYSLVQCV